MFEDFSLNTSIAACAIHEDILPTAHATSGCGVNAGDGVTTIYQDTCDYQGDKNVCYHTPIPENGLFGS